MFSFYFNYDDFYMKDEFYIDIRAHTCNKSIAHFNVFRKDSDKDRFLNVIEFYNDIHCKGGFSWAIRMKDPPIFKGIMVPHKNQLIKILAYCIMPDHYHLVFRSHVDHETVYKFINDIQNAYTRYFNTKYNRKGPLWQSDYRSVEVESNEQLLHLTRYIHLNPTTSSIVTLPEDYLYSSYGYYRQQENYANMKEISINNAKDYINFVNNNIEYQRDLRNIRKIILE